MSDFLLHCLDLQWFAGPLQTKDKSKEEANAFLQGVLGMDKEHDFFDPNHSSFSELTYQQLIHLAILARWITFCYLDSPLELSFRKRARKIAILVYQTHWLPPNAACIVLGISIKHLPSISHMDANCD